MASVIKYLMLKCFEFSSETLNSLVLGSKVVAKFILDGDQIGWGQDGFVGLPESLQQCDAIATEIASRSGVVGRWAFQFEQKSGVETVV